MLIKVIDSTGKVLRDSFHADRVPAVGETYRVGSGEYKVKELGTDSPDPQDGTAPNAITVVTVEAVAAPAKNPSGQKQAHGKQQLRG